MSRGHLLIVGGGIGGLSAALAAQKAGFKVSVFEQAEQIKEVGAGVLITPNGNRVLQSLRVYEAIANTASIEQHSYFLDYQSAEVLRKTSASDIYSRYGSYVLQVHRADLQKALFEQVIKNDPGSVRTAHRFVRLEQQSQQVTAYFENGERVIGDGLIGADGAASVVRENVFGSSKPRFTGQVAMRALVPRELVPVALGEMKRALYVGPNRMFLHYPLRQGALMNVIGIGRSNEWQEEGWAVPATNDEFKAIYEGFHSRVQELIASIPVGNLFKWGLRDREPLTHWVQGLVAMLGDAAHPITPFLGQGANIALEDSLVLGMALRDSDSFSEAINRYERARKERATNVQIWSREQADRLQGIDGNALGPGVTAEQLGLFSYAPEQIVWEAS